MFNTGTCYFFENALVLVIYKRIILYSPFYLLIKGANNVEMDKTNDVALLHPVLCMSKKTAIPLHTRHFY